MIRILLIIASLIATVVIGVMGLQQAAGSDNPTRDIRLLGYTSAVWALFLAVLFFGVSYGQTTNGRDGYSLKLQNGWSHTARPTKNVYYGDFAEVYANKEATITVGTKVASGYAIKSYEENIDNRNVSKKKVHGIRWIVTKAGNTTIYKTVYHNHAYTVFVEGDGAKVFKSLRLKHFGLRFGILDGGLSPVISISRILNNSIAFYKKVNNGFMYIFGYMLGMLVSLIPIVWAAIMCSPLYRRLGLFINKAYWKMRWRSMTIQQKLDRVKYVYDVSQSKNHAALDVAESRYKQCCARAGSPEAALDRYHEYAAAVSLHNKEWWERVKNFLSAFSRERKSETGKFNMIYEVFEFYKVRLEVEYLKANIHHTTFCYCRKVAVLNSKLLEEITAIKIKDRDVFEDTQMAVIGFNELELNREIKTLAENIEVFERNHEQYAKKTFSNVAKNYELAAGSVPIVGVAIIGLAIIATHVNKMRSNRAIIHELKRGQDEIASSIISINDDRSRIAERALIECEIVGTLEELVNRFSNLYETIKGEELQSENQRTPEMKKKVYELSILAQGLVQVVDKSI